MSRPVARPVKSTGRPTEMAGQPVWSPCLMGLAANVMGRAGVFGNLMGWTGPGREFLKMRWAGPAPGPSSEELMGRAGPRPIK